MGNDVSTKSARTLIPLDESVYWQLYNGINEHSEPISIFISKQTYSVECRRSIQFLKTIRHPNIIKFLNDFKTFIDHDSFIADCVHPLANKLNTNDMDSTAKLSLGLYQLTQALEFLHEKASISHNNICLLSLYISLNGIWKLGNFECACRYDNLNKKYLSSLKLIRSEQCITPEENEKNSNEINKQEIFAIDIYAFGTLIRNFLTIINVDDSLKILLNNLQINLTEEEPQLRPTWSILLQTQLFQIDYIKVIELLDRLPTINQSDLDHVVDSLSKYLDELDIEYLNELLIRRLLVPFMFLCLSTKIKILPRILIPKDNINENSWITIEKYRLYVIPILIDLYSYHVTCIRQTLLEYFKFYWQLIDRTIVINIILPQLIYGLKDSNDTICMLTLNALAAMVPVLGADIVVGGQRRQIFSDKIKKDNVAFPKSSMRTSTTNSPLPTPPPLQRSRKTSPITTNKTKLPRLKPTSPVKTISDTNEQSSPPPPLPSLPPPIVLPQYTNGHYSSSNNSVEEPQVTTVQNGLSDNHIDDEIDNDDGQWSDWEHNPESIETSTNYSETFSSPPPSIPSITEPITSKPASSPVKSLKLNPISKPKWDPNAPLGSEYEISSAILTKNKPKQVETSTNEDTDDFFKDMMPKVETVELIRQLETMFNVNTDQPNQQIKSTTTTTSSSLFSNKFGIMSQDQDDNQQTENENNNWDE